jgi:hypothetical protein
MTRPLVLISLSNVASESLEKITGDTKIIYSDTLTAEVIIHAGGMPQYLPAIDVINEELIDQ